MLSQFAFFFGATFFPLIYYLCKYIPTYPPTPFLHSFRFPSNPCHTPPLALYFQVIQDASAIDAGMKLLPLLISVVVSSIVSGALITATGYYNPFILTEIAMVAVGAGLITTLDLSTPFARVFGFLVLDGLGTGVGFQAGVVVVQNVVSRELVPQATSCVQFFQSLGGALSIAVAQTVFQNGLIRGLASAQPPLDPAPFIHSGASQIREVLAATHPGEPAALEAALAAYMGGLRHTYYIAAAAAALAFLAALGLQWKKIEKVSGGPDPFQRACYETMRACTPAPEFDTMCEGAGELQAARKLQKKPRSG